MTQISGVSKLSNIVIEQDQSDRRERSVHFRGPQGGCPAGLGRTTTQCFILPLWSGCGLGQPFAIVTAGPRYEPVKLLDNMSDEAGLLPLMPPVVSGGLRCPRFPELELGPQPLGN